MKRFWLLLLAGCGTTASTESAPGFPLAGPIRPLWAAAARFAAALPNGDAVYAEDRLVCADGETGRVKWSADVDFDGWFQAAATLDSLIVYESEGLLRSFDLATGKEKWRRGIPAARANLVVIGGRVYVWNATYAAAYDPASLDRAWEVRADDGPAILRLVADTRRVALDFEDETAELEYVTGFVRFRRLGRTIGWSGEDAHVLKRDEVWVWRGGAFVRSSRLNGYDGGPVFLRDGDVLHVATLRYFTGGRFRAGQGDLPQSVETVREIVCGSKWHLPIEGPVHLAGSTIVEELRDGLRGRDARDGAALWETKGRVRSWSVGGGRLYVVTADGRVTAYRLT